jgi:hypothetical protein
VIRRLVLALVAAAIAGVVVKSLPDITRYMKIRDM